MQEIINVICYTNSTIDHVKSFVINDSIDTLRKNQIIDESEKYFMDLIDTYNEGSDKKLFYADYIDQGYYSNPDVEIYLSWSI